MKMHRPNINRGCSSPQSRRALPSRPFLSISSLEREKSRDAVRIRRIIRYALPPRKHTVALGGDKICAFGEGERTASKEYSFAQGACNNGRIPDKQSIVSGRKLLFFLPVFYRIPYHSF